MKKRTHRTAAYGRKSGRQLDHSVAAQLKVIRKYAKHHGFEIVRTYADSVKGGGKS